MSQEQMAANAFTVLGMDAVQRANSGHPGMVMGMADIATVLWGEFVNYDPDDAAWADRDRVVLSNGHGSMLLYAALHLTGQSLTLDDLKEFRQWGAKTAGHPEFGYAAGIETTTGPLGQGIANGVGMAMAERWIRDNFDESLTDHFTYVMVGDGCLMEGISAEAASIAGHLGLGRLIVLYDDNEITIDGRTDIAFGENVCARFEAYGWETTRIDGHDRDAIRQAIQKARSNLNQPSLIACRTVIAKHAPTKADSSSAHGSPLGEDEIRAVKTKLGLNPDGYFEVPDDAYAYFQRRHHELREIRKDWDARLEGHDRQSEFVKLFQDPDINDVEWPTFEPGSKMATRAAGGKLLQAIATGISNVVGGSADLEGSNKTKIAGRDFTRESFKDARTIRYGVREHAMAAITNGLILHGGLHPFCATFLVFHDYMRPSVRLSALMHQPVLYIYTHDSIFVGEDGPTHQPIEHVESMRLIPNLWVVRPADANEAVVMYKRMLERRDGPSAVCLTRQGLPVLDPDTVADAKFGGYVLRDFTSETSTQRCILVATGSEVSLAIEAVSVLESKGWDVRVVSMPCRELFAAQALSYQQTVLLQSIPTVAVEAGRTGGWTGFGAHAALGIDRFGASAPGNIVAEQLGLHVNGIVERVEQITLH